MPRLVKTVSQMEGRFEESWALVDDRDELPLWESDQELLVVGQPTPRADGLVRATGSARYTADVRLPGMLQAAVLRSRVAHGRVRSLDLEAARAVPGVRAVVGPEDDLGITGSPLLTSEPSYVGEPIAAVAADTAEAAAAALEALAPDVEPLGFSVSMDEALAEQRFTKDPDERVRGDVDAALAAADVTVEVAISTPDQLQTPIEPHGGVASWQGDELTAWISTQGMFDARGELCRRFGLATEQVRVITEFVGGGFGAKQRAGTEALLAAVLARRAGRPVRLVNTRHEEQGVAGRRAATRQSVRLGANRDGRLVAVDADALVAIGVAGLLFPVTTPAMTLYACEDARGLAFPLRLNLAPSNAFRAPGVMEGIAVLEQAMDELAAALDLDPLELRRRNHVDVDQGGGQPYSTKGLGACMDRAAELAGWSNRDALRGAGPDGLLRGMGCALQIWWGSGNPPAHAELRLGSDGVALLTCGIQDIGTGTFTTARMVAAEAAGLPLESVRVRGGDTGPNLYAPVAGGSLTTPSVMPAVRSAGEDLCRQVLELAGDVFEANPDDLTLRGGRVRSADGALDESVEHVVGKLGNATVTGVGGRGPNPEGRAVHSFGCQIAQVAVDPGTGEVRVERIVAAHDVGRIVNPLGASSQVEGGVLQGLAFALSEELVIDPTTGAPTNATLDDYKVPTIADVPEIVVDFVQLPDLYASNIGSKGLGEPPIIPTAGAIANAFAHATGRRVTALPLTRARVLEALEA